MLVRASVTVIAATLAFAVTAEAQALYTPRTGSPERQRICDAARRHLFERHIARNPPSPVIFRVDEMHVQGPYCYFQAVPMLKSGGYAAPDYMDDIAYTVLLWNSAGGWTVIVDLSRTDVPSSEEAAQIRSRLPADLPMTVLSSTWRGILR